jgi:hypothetical protein
LEDDIRSIRFVVRPHAPLGEAASPEAIPELVKRLRCSTTGNLFETPQVVDPSVIPKLAAAGPGVIPPLIAKLKTRTARFVGPWAKSFCKWARILFRC